MLIKKSVNQCHQWSSLNFTHAVQNPWQSPLVLFVTFGAPGQDWLLY
jgi:hypothetical protein